MMSLSLGLSLTCGRASSFSFNFTGGSLSSAITPSGGANGTTVNSSGLIASATTPRFYYDPLSLAADGLLVEAARTNVTLYSEQLQQAAAWSLNSCTVSADQIPAPDGNTTADKVISANATALTGPSNTFTSTAAAWTWSVFVKQGSGIRYIQLLLSGGASANYANFDLLNGTVTAGTYSTAAITAFPNGWYRISMTFTPTAGAGQACYVIAVPASNSTRATSFVGDGAKYFYAWGAQMELGATASSYIATTSASVTRSADSLTFTIPAGVATLRYVFDDNSTQDVSVSAGSYTIPTTLNRAAIKTVYSL